MHRRADAYGSIFLYFGKKEVKRMKKDNRYATNKGGVIKAPKPTSGSPNSTIVKGDDLRNGKKK